MFGDEPPKAFEAAWMQHNATPHGGNHDLSLALPKDRSPLYRPTLDSALAVASPAWTERSESGERPTPGGKSKSTNDYMLLGDATAELLMESVLDWIREVSISLLPRKKRN